jgi:tyrosinase
MVKQRKDINSLSATEIADYIHALNILRQRSASNPDDPTGYDFQAGLHNDPTIGPCEHGNDLFLAWHRAHLHYFEKLLQESDAPRTANVTIPYWDWLHKESVGKFPAAFDEPGLSEPDRNLTDTLLPADTREIVTEERDWSAFGGYPREHPGSDYGRLELDGHNYMHPFYIGGKMADSSTAAEDPIYFSFHCFIDLLWAEWQRRNGMPAPTSPNADLRGFSSQPKHRVGDFQNTTTLDYEYQYTDKLKQAFEMAPPAAPEPRKLLTTEKLQPLFEGSITTQLRETGQLQYGLPTPTTTDATVVVRLQQLKIPTTGSYMLRAYVHPRDVPFDPNDAEFSRLHSVGYVALWQAHGTGDGHHDHPDHDHSGQNHRHPPQPHHPTSATVRFDITKAVAGATSEATSDQVLSLEFIPAPGPAGESTPAQGLVEEVAFNDATMEVYG